MKKMFAIVLALMLCVSVLSVAAFAAGETYTIHVQVPEGTGTPNIWAWGVDNAMPSGAQWPGVAMTEEGDWYTFVVPVGTNGMVINTDGDTDKSGDITMDGTSDVWVVLTLDESGHFAQESISYEAPGSDDNNDNNSNDNNDNNDNNEDNNTENTEVSYYVAGVEALCGSNWKENDEANKMTKGDNGIYTITYSNVAAGDYELKVTDGTWTNSWGKDGGNYAFSVAEAADVTVEFDAATTTVTVKVGGKTAEDNKTEDNKNEDNKVDPNASYYVAGVSAICGSEWKENDAANKMTYKDGVYTITYKDVAAGKYSLKVTDGTWTNSWGGNGENGNFDFEVTAKNDVTVEFNPAKNQVSIIIGNERIDGPATTGDVSLAAVSVALLAATAGLVAIVSKKKEF